MSGDDDHVVCHHESTQSVCSCATTFQFPMIACSRSRTVDTNPWDLGAGGESHGVGELYGQEISFVYYGLGHSDDTIQ